MTWDIARRWLGMGFADALWGTIGSTTPGNSSQRSERDASANMSVADSPGPPSTADRPLGVSCDSACRHQRMRCEQQSVAGRLAAGRFC
jgi:hypothetical protein